MCFGRPGGKPAVLIMNALTGQELPMPGYFRTLKEEARISTETFEKIAWRNANTLLGLGLDV